MPPKLTTQEQTELYFKVISPAADDAIELARLMRESQGDEYYGEAGGVGFGFRFAEDGSLRVIVDWQGKRQLQVNLPDGYNDQARGVQPFEYGGPWVEGLHDTVRGLKQLAAWQAEAGGDANDQGDGDTDRVE